MDIGKKIKKYREQSNISQDELALKVFVSRQTISNWETNKSYPDIKSLAMLSNIFQVSLDDFIKEDIKEMKRKVDSSQIKKFNVLNMVFFFEMLIMIISAYPLFKIDGYIGVIIWFVIFIITLITSVIAERFKKSNNVQTYKEIISFLENKNLTYEEEQQELGKRVYQKIVFAIGAAVIALIICLITIFITENIQKGEVMTITEKYALFLLKEHKKLYDNETSPYLLVSMMSEMIINDNLEINNNKIKITSKVPNKNYNKKLYELINYLCQELKKEEIDIKKVLNYICYGFTSKNERSIIDALKEDMFKDNLITLEEKKGLFGIKEIIVVNEDNFNTLINDLRAEFLEKGNLTEDYILLGSLLLESKFLKNVFNKYENETLNKRLKEIKDSEIASKVKIARELIMDASAFMVVIIASTMNSQI